ncbi:olfactory receptor 4B13-like [Nothobranchius furzeri]|uniref:Olfactory receptor n=1 Tax=Nothobranchius furzeri TaxID=105023 RepID=A0A9D2Y752_NOTFU|nr:olfactory receptor 142-like [Nothobranchius furzeri]KAF7215277.1 olfactory receptor 142-like [Nothobranchius furzeri]
MDSRLNETDILLGGYVEVERYRFVYFFIMFTAYLLILAFNFLFICLIIVHRNLHEPMYIFIASLLINCILFSTNIFPKLLIDFLSEKPVISYKACLFQAFTFYTSGCSEFLLLAAMAYDRYVSICKPLQYRTIMTKTTVSAFLFLAWFLPACHVLVLVLLSCNNKLCSHTIKGILCNNAVYSLYCVTSVTTSVFGTIALFNMGIFPMFFIVFSYAKILVIAYRNCGEVRQKATQTCLPHLLVLINYSILFTYDIIIVKVRSDFPQIARLVMTLQIITYNPLCNPLIYGLKMKEISKHLKGLFCRANAHKF